MRVYAVVGGIAAGKSTVARRMARAYGGTWIDADRVGHRVLELQRVRQRLLDAFGPDIVGPSGGIDRSRLGTRVFGHPARLRRLNAIVHPEIARRVRARLAALARRGERFVLLDAALYFEFDLGWTVDGVLAVVATRGVRRRRLQARSGLAPEAAAARLRSQPKLGTWIRRADVRLDNNGARTELDGRIQEAWRELRRLPRSRRGRN
jgi:dephospho-CoA kinase